MKWGIPLAMGILVRMGRGLMRKDLGKKKEDPRKNEQKKSIWCRQDTAEYAGKRILAVRVPAIGHDCLLID